MPPEEERSRRAPRDARTSQAWPTPRSLKEPLGCSASIFSQTRWPGREYASDSMSGVVTCSGIRDSAVGQRDARACAITYSASPATARAIPALPRVPGGAPWRNTTSPATAKRTSLACVASTAASS